MQEISFEGHLTKRSRPLIHALIISVAFNLGLLATFITFILREKKIETLFQVETNPKQAPSFAPLCLAIGDMIKEMENTPFQMLIDQLLSEERLEQGYQKRDLALACLVNYHHFDLERALPGIKLQKRLFVYSPSGKTIELMPGLNHEHFEAIYSFARLEKWPLTSQGLFEKMKQSRENLSPSLSEAFFFSKEFYQIERAFSRLPFIFTKDILLHLLLDGSWNLIKETSELIGLHPMGEIEMIGPFLAGFKGSKLAAYLLIALDPDYAYSQFSDEHLKSFITLLDQKTKEATVFLNRIVTSLRSDEVRTQAIEALRFDTSKPPPQSEEYIVQKGDSLWGLSFRFGLSVEKIRKLNHLQSDRLTPGQVLKIPKENQSLLDAKGGI